MKFWAWHPNIQTAKVSSHKSEVYIRLGICRSCLTLSLPSSKSTFSQTEVVRLGSIIICRLNKLKSQLQSVSDVIFLVRQAACRGPGTVSALHAASFRAATTINPFSRFSWPVSVLMSNPCMALSTNTQNGLQLRTIATLHITAWHNRLEVQLEAAFSMKKPFSKSESCHSKNQMPVCAEDESVMEEESWTD